MVWRPRTPRGAPRRVVGHHHRQRRLEDPVDLDAGEPFGGRPPGVGEVAPLHLDVVVEGASAPRVGDEDEVPGLGQPDARCAVGGVEHPVEDVLVDGLAGELGPDVAPAVDRLVQADRRRGPVHVGGLCTRRPRSPARHWSSGRSSHRTLTAPSATVAGAGATSYPAVTSRTVPDQPWQGDACSLVEAFRAGSITPVEALDLSLAAIERSELNAVIFVDEERARAAAASADPRLPFGGVPVGIKELDRVAGWPRPRRLWSLKDRIGTYDSPMLSRLKRAGIVPVGQTAASEFGGINLTYTRLHGATRNPWRIDRTPGGSSGGSAAAVAGGLLPIATGADGGGSIRIPAAFTGLFGLKATFGRIPKGPHTEIEPLHRGVRLSQPLRAGHRPLVRRLQRGRRRAIRSACPGSRAGRPVSERRNWPASGRSSPSTWVWRWSTRRSRPS